jgi:hypothetical protein
VRLAELKAAVSEARQQAASLPGHGPDGAVAELYTTLFADLHAQVTSASAPGWPQVVLLVTELANRLPLDALEKQYARQLQVRAAALLDLPDVTYLTTLEDLRAPMRADLEISRVRRDAGDMRGCCTVHWATGRTLLAAQVARAFPGYAKAMHPIRQAFEVEPPKRVLDEKGASFYAFTMRLAFEQALAVMG